MKGDITKSENFKYVYVLHTSFTAASSFTIRIPKLKNPTGTINLNTRVYL